MLIPRERRIPGLLVLVALIGWTLAGLFWWQGREPAGALTVKDQETVQTLAHEQFDEATVSRKPPATIAAPGPKDAPLVAHARGSVPRTEDAPPQVEPADAQVFDVSVYIPASEGGDLAAPVYIPAPNWTLRPGDLGLKTWDFTIRRVKRRAFVQLSGTLEAMTPVGMVERPFVTDPDDEQGWVSSSALPGGRYVDFEASVTTGLTADFVVNWGTGGHGWGVGPQYDFDRRRWQAVGRFRFGRIER